MVQTKPDKNSSFYAVQISSWLSELNCFHLKWYEGNIYEESEEPESSSLSMSLGEVQKAYEENFLELPNMSYINHLMLSL